MINNNNIVAEAVRVERDDSTGELYLVFKIIDESFKQNIIKDWMKDVELKLINKKLYKI